MIKSSKKILSIFLAIIMISTFNIISFAADPEIKLVPSATEAEVGDTITVAYKISEGFTGFVAVINFDSAYLEYVKAVETGLMNTEIGTVTENMIRFASLSINPVPAGTLLTVEFKVKKTNAEISVTLNEVLDKNNNDISANITVAPIIIASTHEHIVDTWTVTSEPTCARLGLKEGACSVCNEIIYQEIPILDHTPSEWVIVQEPTCTETGEKKKVCTSCGVELSNETISAINHANAEWITLKEPTYTEKGLKGLLCNDCGQMIRWESIPILEENTNDGILYLGDIDSDGDFTIADYSYIKLFLDGRLQLEEKEAFLADINTDGTVDAFDIFLLNNIINHITSATVTYQEAYDKWLASKVSTDISSTSWQFPLKGRYYVSQHYGNNGNKGVDLAGCGGQPVYAVAAGKVLSAEYHYSWGYNVLIDHGNGIWTRYAHLESGSLEFSAGQQISAGQQLGIVGSTGNSTGPHLHFEVWKNGARINPEPYINL